MFWPKNYKRYENLKSSFVNLQNLMEDLSKTGFEGFLELIFGEGLFYILRRKNGEDKIYREGETGKFVPADVTLSEITDRSLREMVTINVYDVDSEQLEFLSGCLNSIPLYTNLSSEFTDFRKLLGKLSKDEHNGYLEVSFQNAHIAPAYIFYRHGEVNSIFWGIFWGDQQFEKLEREIREIDSKLKENEAQFNVYQIVSGSRYKKNETPKLKREEKVFLKYKTPGNKKSVSGPVRLDERNIKPQEKERKTEKSIEGTPPSEEKSHLQKAHDTSINEVENLSIFPYLDFAEALVRWVEEAVNNNMGKNYFSKAFKKGLLNISDKYPFLDPFLAEFTYMDGKINFTSEATVTEFLNGIYAAIESLLEELTVKEKENIQKRLKQTLKGFERNHHEDIEILRVRTLMPTLFL